MADQKYSETAREWIRAFWSARTDYFYRRSRSVVAYKDAEKRMNNAVDELQKLGIPRQGHKMPTLDEVDKANKCQSQ